MNFRPAIGFVTGYFAWWVLFVVVGTTFGVLWPAYRAAARLMFETGEFSLFSTPMLLLNFLLFLIAGLLTGWLVSLISRNRVAALALALLYFAQMGFNHFHLVWGKLPDWYNVVVPFVIAASIALGSRLRKQANDPATAATPG